MSERCRLLNPETVGQIRTEVLGFVPSGENNSGTKVTLVCEHIDPQDVPIRNRSEVDQELMYFIADTHPQTGVSEFIELFEASGLIAKNQNSNGECVR